MENKIGGEVREKILMSGFHFLFLFFLWKIEWKMESFQFINMGTMFVSLFFTSSSSFPLIFYNVLTQHRILVFLLIFHSIFFFSRIFRVPNRALECTSTQYVKHMSFMAVLS